MVEDDIEEEEDEGRSLGPEWRSDMVAERGNGEGWRASHGN